MASDNGSVPRVETPVLTTFRRKIRLLASRVVRTYRDGLKTSVVGVTSSACKPVPLESAAERFDLR